jgi:endonuclease G
MNTIESILKNEAMAREIAGKVSLLLSRPSVAAGAARGLESAAEAERAAAAATVPESEPDVLFAPAAPDAESSADALAAVSAAVPSAGVNEAIIKRFGRPVLLVRNNTFEVPASDTWAATLYPNKSKLDAAIPSVGRVELVSAIPPYIGTAWMITRDIAVTNRHVALEFASRENGKWGFRVTPNGKRMRMRVDFREEYLQTVTFDAEIAEILFVAEPVNSEPDLAFIRLKSNGVPLPPPMPLFAGTLSNGQKLAVIGYPAEDSRNGAADQARIFSNIFDAKRIAPGEVTGTDGNFVFTHDCSTLGGNSGSPIIDIETGTVVGLHFAGEYLLDNYAVRASKIREYLERIDPEAVIASPPPIPDPQTFEISIEDLQNRDGYQPDFLGTNGFEVPLPTVSSKLAGRAFVVNESAEGTRQFMLDYTHFSLAMHEDRRMAIFTASNIDGELSLNIKRRKDSWGFDPRLPREVQIGHELYLNNDLDRGHLVRRRDPVWGDPNIAKQAEQDTFFFTNCTPQHSGFNQNTWLSLEDYLFENADTRNFKACIFTGPIFSENDRLYRDVLLPLAFWKVAVMIHDQRNELTATAYIVSQKNLLSDLEFVFGQFKTYQVSIASIEQKTGLDFGELKQFDPLAQQESVLRDLQVPEDIRL